MDRSITLVTPAMQRERGAQAFDEGRGIDDHYMNPGAPAVHDWQIGWLDRQAEVEGSRADGILASPRLAAAGT